MAVMAVSNLLSALEFDLEDHVPSRWRFGQRCSVEVAEEVGPLEKPITVDVRLEIVPGREDVGIVCLTLALGTSGPATA